ncbi:DUF4136 domain-containing protein [Thalassotalea sp. ND16A]|uniref:DUF4136 domain-containing protein n=1 Tax=Thalassotalea sp. ND16A TaxID=1535422 RepID=UPI00051A7D42|nr:DUF4136 domain-containing protein [Thalassotalea sp. ND16A]KGJ99590.1 hypothetical protein ND16A_3690 [Thalassotalea sp. ND16A]
MKAIKLILIPLVLLLSACSTTYQAESDYNSAYDFNAVQSFHVVGDERLNNPMLSDIDRDRINVAISESLSAQGKQAENKESADVLVEYFVLTKDKTKIYSTSAAGYANCYRCGYGYGAGVSNISSRDYVEGTIVVDVIDNVSQKTIWRSTLSKKLQDFDNATERNEAIKLAVNAIFKEFPAS